MSNQFMNTRITFLCSKRGRNSNNKISLISSSKLRKSSSKNKYPQLKKNFKEDDREKDNIKQLFKKRKYEKDKYSDFNSQITFSTTNSHYNSDYSEYEENQKSKIFFKEFTNENNEKIKFRCVNDNIFNLEKIISKEKQKEFWNEIDNDIKTDDEQLKREQKKVNKFVNEVLENIQNDKNYLKNNLSKKLKFKHKKKINKHKL